MTLPRILPIIVLLPMALIRAADFIVSPVGSDFSGDGSVTNPLATLSRCVSMLKQVPTRAGPTSRRCLLRGGNYAEENTILLDHLNGTSANPIVVTAYDRDNEPPVVMDGTAPLTNLKWSQSKQDKDVWSAAIDSSAAPEG